MANVLFCSDLHFGHQRIHKLREFRPLYGADASEQSHRDLIKMEWREKVTKRDVVYVLGDAAFTMETVSDFADLPGRKILVRGNHDLLDTQVYLKYFDDVYGLLKYKEFWLSHAPVHPDELRGRINLHGHVHYANVTKPFFPGTDVMQKLDTRYVNCCPENLWPLVGSSLISLDEVRSYLKSP